MGPIFTGEVRHMEMPFTNDPGVLAGASLASNPAITILEKVGEADVTAAMLLGPATTPARAAPTIVGNSIHFWVLAGAAGRFHVRATATGDNTELMEARDILLVVA